MSPDGVWVPVAFGLLSWGLKEINQHWTDLSWIMTLLQRCFTAELEFVAYLMTFAALLVILMFITVKLLWNKLYWMKRYIN